jgi:hypothetical protein
VTEVQNGDVLRRKLFKRSIYWEAQRVDEVSNATDESVGHPVLSVYNLSFYGSVPCYGLLNLVLSPNFTPPPNHPDCNTREGTSTLGCESVNLMRESKMKPSKRKYGITATKLSSPGWRARSLSLSTFAAPHAHNFCIQISPSFLARSAYSFVHRVARCAYLFVCSYLVSPCSRALISTIFGAIPFHSIQ